MANAPSLLPPSVRRTMLTLRGLVRLYVGLEGLAILGLAWGLAFWLGLLLDWTWEPSPTLRAVGLLLWLLLTLYLFVRYLLLRALAPLPTTSLALLLERNFPEFKESLITTVEATAARPAGPSSHTLLQQTSQQAAAVVSQIRLRKIFQLRPLVLKMLGACLLTASIVGFAWAQGGAFDFWLQRLQLSHAPWPRRVELSVPGFEQLAGEYVAKVARDADFDLQAFASLRNGHTAPEEVELRYTLADGRRGRYPMTQVGAARAGQDTAQEFRYRFQNLAEDVWFDVVGGDDRLRNLRLQVVPRPQILTSEVQVNYPAYLQQVSQTVPFRGRVELPEGCQAVFELVANKPLQGVSVHDPAEQSDVEVTIDQDHPQAFRFPLEIGNSDRLLLLTLHDHDGVENREPDRLVVSVLSDEPPAVNVQITGIGTALTPQARIPFTGKITDAYGIVDIWYELQIDDQPLLRKTPASQPAGRQVFPQLEALDLAAGDAAGQPIASEEISSAPFGSERKPTAVQLQPGQKLSLGVVARDAYDLQETPHTGSSRRWLFDVVTASELRSLLEKRELALRQRFAAIYEKTLSIQDLLQRIETTAEQTPAAQASPAAPKPNAATPDDATSRPNPQQVAANRERDRLRIGGALQNVTQLAYETIGVAAGIAGIVEELVNNRVATEELKNRLLTGIATPLRALGTTRMPRLQERIQDLQTAHAEQVGVPAAQQQVLDEMEQVLMAMQQVLERMLELESYNELVELLRGIVQEQEELQEQTQRERREKLRRLLEED